MSVHKAVLYFGVCTRSIQQWKKSSVAKPITGRKRKISKEKISADVEKYPDDYQYERAERFGVSTHLAARPSNQS